MTKGALDLFASLFFRPVHLWVAGSFFYLTLHYMPVSGISPFSFFELLQHT